jgi:hypothetical protein
MRACKVFLAKPAGGGRTILAPRHHGSPRSVATLEGDEIKDTADPRSVGRGDQIGALRIAARSSSAAWTLYNHSDFYGQLGRSRIGDY